MRNMADFTIQLLTQILSTSQKKTDYFHEIQETVDTDLGWWDRCVADLEARKTQGTHARRFDDFVRDYKNTAGFFLIRIALANGKF